MAVKKKKRTWVVAIVVIAAILAAGYAGVRALNGAFDDIPALDSYKQAAAEKGTIATTLTATSNLAEDEAPVEIPYGVKVAKVYVEAGDYVAKGERVASIDKASLAEELKAAREKLEGVDAQIGRDGRSPGLDEVRSNIAESLAALEALDGLDDKEIFAGVSGIVKTVNIVEGEALSRAAVVGLPSGAASIPDLSGLGGMYPSIDMPDMAGLLSSGQLAGAQIDWTQVFGTMSETDRNALIGQIVGSIPPQTTIAAVPSLIGLTPAQAGAVLGILGLRLGAVAEGQVAQDGSEAPDTTKEGIIIAQSMAPGEIVNMGTAVGVTVYKKPAPPDPGDEEPDPEGDPEPLEAPGARPQGNPAGQESPEALLQGYSLLSPEEARAPRAERTMMGFDIPDILGGATGDSSSGSTVDAGPLGAAVLIVPVDTFAVNVMIDELDILSVMEGQEAAVEFDALPGQSFTGVVTRVGDSSSSGYGSVQYPVKLTLDREPEMRIGMNVTVIIRTSEKQGVLKLPAAAVQEDEQGAFVYTGVDGSGALSDPVYITTGLSDGREVEVVAGLEKDAAVYYEEIAIAPRSGRMMF